MARSRRLAHHRLRRSDLHQSAFYGHSVAVGGLAADPVQIPYFWLSPPLSWVPDQLYTAAHVSTDQGVASRAIASSSSIDRFGEQLFEASLETPSSADPSVLTHFVTTWYVPASNKAPRMRAAAMALVLNSRTVTEQALILGVTIGRRIRITGAPSSWPELATEQVVEGISHAHGPQARAVAWITSPILNAAASDPEWFRLGTSSLGGTDYMPY